MPEPACEKDRNWPHDFRQSDTIIIRSIREIRGDFDFVLIVRQSAKSCGQLDSFALLERHEWAARFSPIGHDHYPFDP